MTEVVGIAVNEIHPAWVPSTATLTALVVISNVLYLWPGWTAFKVHYLEVAAFHVVVTIISSFHHLCFDGNICFGIPSQVFSRLDISFALVAVGVTLMTPAIYEYLILKRLSDISHENYTVKRYVRHRHRKLSSSSDEEDDDERPPNTKAKKKGKAPSSTSTFTKHSALVKHTYADLFIVFYVVLMIVLVAISESNTLMIYGGIVVYIALTYLFHWFLFTKLKRQNVKYRYDWIALALAAILSAFSVLIFHYIEHIEGRHVHSIWHIFGALTSQTFIMGTTGQFRPVTSRVSKKSSAKNTSSCRW